MARLLRLVTAVSVLLVASLTGCLLSADQSAAMDVISVNAHGQNVRQLWSGGLPFAEAGMIIVALAVYSIRMRRSLCRLSISHANQNRFLEAIDQSHMGIVLFDAEMKTTCRSKGFDRQFADLIPLVSAGASIVQICAFAFENGVFTSDLEGADPDVVAGAIAARANEGQGDCRIVRTLVGQAFDMRVFRLDSGGFAALWLDISDVCHPRFVPPYFRRDCSACCSLCKPAVFPQRMAGAARQPSEYGCANLARDPAGGGHVVV